MPQLKPAIRMAVTACPAKLAFSTRCSLWPVPNEKPPPISILPEPRGIRLDCRGVRSLSLSRLAPDSRACRAGVYQPSNPLPINPGALDLRRRQPSFQRLGLERPFGPLSDFGFRPSDFIPPPHPKCPGNPDRPRQVGVLSRLYRRRPRRPNPVRFERFSV